MQNSDAQQRGVIFPLRKLQETDPSESPHALQMPASLWDIPSYLLPLSNASCAELPWYSYLDHWDRIYMSSGCLQCLFERSVSDS